MRKSLGYVLHGFILAAMAASPSWACSMQACIGEDGHDGVEVSSNFEVVIRYGKTPLPGVQVTITGDSAPIVLMTDAKGKVRFRKVPAGNYWIHAEMMGVWVGGECFHIRKYPTTKAKWQFSYDAGYYRYTTSTVEGKLTDLILGNDESPLLKLAHRRPVPIRGSTVSLKSTFSSVSLITRTDESGAFNFASVPDGVYVLRVEGGMSEREYGSTAIAIEVINSAVPTRLVFEQRDSSGGSCGGTEFRLE